MPHAPGLKAILSHLKSQSLKLNCENEQALLCALLLPVALSKGTDAADEGEMQELYRLANALAPEPVRAAALPLPDRQQYRQALALLPVPPHMVQAADPCILGYLYQFFCAPQRQSARRQVQRPNKSIGVAQTISFTQLYTPYTVVDFLLDQCLPDNRRQPDFTVIDPACGAGNFLLRTFDSLLAQLVQSGWSKAAAAAAAVEVLHGCDIDRLGLWITCLSLAARCLKAGLSGGDLPPLKLAWVAPATEGAPALGSLSRRWSEGHLLSGKFDAVVGNPPYLGRKLLDRQLKNELRAEYPTAHHDLCSAFLSRGLELLKPAGRLGYITQSSLLCLPSYAKLRGSLLERHQLVTVVEAGTRVFPLQAGEKVASILLVVENSRPQPGRQTTFVDLTQSAPLNLGACLSSLATGGEIANLYRLEQERFVSQPKKAFNYRCPQAIITISKQAETRLLSSLTEIRQGLATGDNQRFVKWWWQAGGQRQQLSDGFVPYVKGAGGERWYCPIETVVDWRDDGAAIKQSVAERYAYLKGKTQWVVKNERFYFKEGLTFSLVGSRQLCVRVLPPGCIFDVAGSALFPAQADRAWLLAYLNSSFVAACAFLINPTINYQVGDLKQLPVVPLTASAREELDNLAQQCVSLKRCLNCFSETDIGTTLSSDLPPSFEQALDRLEQARKELLCKENEIDRLVLDQINRCFHLDKLDRRHLQQLCSRAEMQRKPVGLPFSSSSEFAGLMLRLVLYEIGPGALSQEMLAAKLGRRRAPIEQALGCAPMQYVCDRFEADQLKALHNSLRLAVHRQDKAGAVLLKQPPLRIVQKSTCGS